MNAHKVAVTLTEDGMLVLKGLPFQAGDAVEIIILEQSKDPQLSARSQAEITLQSSTSYTAHPEAADVDYLAAVSGTLTEWDSDADEIAYSNL